MSPVNSISVPTRRATQYSYPWVPDRNDGTYCNPIIYADYSDPDVIRDGEDFYLVSSSFNCTPGLPILHSKDLVNWQIINHAVKNLPHSRYTQFQPGCGVWAPSIRKHAGKFWIFFPMPDEGIYVTTADHPTGKWSEPHLLEAGKGLIDPCPLWDDDGKAYLVHAYAKSRSGLKHMLRVRPMVPDASRLLGEGKIVFHKPEQHPTLEGPKFLKKEGWYYILAPAGGVENGWQVALRSKDIYGPYEDKIVLEQGSTVINGPHQGALVDGPNGDWWFVHFQDTGLYGRITHLQPVQWRDGWPLMGTGQTCEPVLRHAKPQSGAKANRHAPQTSDEFDSRTLGLQWQWHANHKEDWHALTGNGKLRLFPQFFAPDDVGHCANLLLQKFPARTFSVETQLEFVPKNPGERAGIVVAGKTCAALALERSGADNRLVLRVDGVEKFARDVTSNTARLRVAVADDGVCTFAFSITDGFETIDEPFTAHKGTWIGAKAGLFSQKMSQQKSTGHADFDYFRFA